MRAVNDDDDDDPAGSTGDRRAAAEHHVPVPEGDEDTGSVEPRAALPLRVLGRQDLAPQTGDAVPGQPGHLVRAGAVCGDHRPPGQHHQVSLTREL